MLLKSCAIPPARIPTDSIFAAFWSVSSMRWRSVMSLKTRTAPIRLLETFATGTSLPSMSRMLPTRPFMRVCTGMSADKPRSSTSATGSVASAPVVAFLRRHTSPNLRPTTSEAFHWAISAAARFMKSTRPPASIVTTPSLMLPSVTARRSFSAASASSASRRAVMSTITPTRFHSAGPIAFTATCSWSMKVLPRLTTWYSCS